MITFNKVTKRYNNIPVINNLSFHVDMGEIVFITGPSGAGKSTLLKLLFCSEKPDEGEIIYRDTNIVTIKKSQVPYIRRTMGFVFQEAKLIPYRTVFDNVALVLRVRGIPSKEIEWRVEEALQLVGMKHKMSVLPSALSGGEQQKVAVARAIVHDPLLILADEPTGDLDPDSTWEIFKIFKKINKTGTTMIIATHNYEIVEYMGKRIIPLEKHGE